MKTCFKNGTRYPTEIHGLYPSFPSLSIFQSSWSFFARFSSKITRNGDRLYRLERQIVRLLVILIISTVSIELYRITGEGMVLKSVSGTPLLRMQPLSILPYSDCNRGHRANDCSYNNSYNCRWYDCSNDYCNLCDVVVQSNAQRCRMTTGAIRCTIYRRVNCYVHSTKFQIAIFRMKISFIAKVLLKKWTFSDVIFTGIYIL